jgi:hypothetical protein
MQLMKDVGAAFDGVGISKLLFSRLDLGAGLIYTSFGLLGPVLLQEAILDSTGSSTVTSRS